MTAQRISMKRASTAALILMIVSGCHQDSQKTKAGWQFGSGGRGPRVSYNFGDYRKVTLPVPQAEETVFAGTCDRTPIFLVTGGDYPLGTARFTLIVDDHSWSLRAFQGEHGRALFMDAPDVVAALRNAKNRVAFQVGSWRRELKPSRLIRRFVDECKAKRKVSP